MAIVTLLLTSRWSRMAISRCNPYIFQHIYCQMTIMVYINYEGSYLPGYYVISVKKAGNFLADFWVIRVVNSQLALVLSCLDGQPMATPPQHPKMTSSGTPQWQLEISTDIYWLTLTVFSLVLICNGQICGRSTPFLLTSCGEEW